MLVDTGPIVAIVIRNDPFHSECMKVSRSLPEGPLITTWPCFTEAMYLVFREAGYQAQSALWRMVDGGRLNILSQGADDMNSMQHLMSKYSDLPMDLADASIVAAAERFGIKTLFTLDGHFHVYRLPNGEAFDVVP